MAISSLCNHPIKSHTELIPALGHKPNTEIQLLRLLHRMVKLPGNAQIRVVM